MRIILQDNQTGRTVQRDVRSLFGWPAWIVLTALAVAAAVIALPIIALGMAAAVVGAIVLGVLVLIGVIVGFVRHWWFRLTGSGPGRPDGRRNVIVLRPGEKPGSPRGWD